MMGTGFKHQEDSTGLEQPLQPCTGDMDFTSYYWKTKVFARCWNAWRTWALSKTATPK